jgi:hypothetical protein
MKTQNLTKRMTIAALTVLFATIYSGMNAQHHIGVVSGVNLSNQVSNVENWAHSMRPMATVGLTVDLAVNEDISIVLQPSFTGKGSSIRDTRENDLTYEFKHKYLELPVLFRYGFGSTIRPYVQAGPYAAILLNSKLGGSYDDLPLSGDLKRVTAGIDVGVNVGGGVQYNLNRVRFSLEASYDIGILNSMQAGTIDIKYGDQTGEGTVMATDKGYNRGLRILAGVSMSLGKEK